jgi:branched-chain amino acid aminotransferase
LLVISGFDSGNIKILVYEQGQQLHTVVYFVPHFYPTIEEYLRGVNTKTYSFERPDPGIKRWNASFREDVRAFIERENIYEALLVTGTGLVTEGSRSNLFFIDESDSILTAPATQILPGITRKYVLKLCQEKKIPVTVRPIKNQELGKMKACFLSGTSPKVLPVRKIDTHSFDVDNRLLKTLMEAYEKLILEQMKD